MESKTRHDLRHPIATISMIASTMAEFGATVDADTARMYGDQVIAEVGSFRLKMREHAIDLDVAALERAAAEFARDPLSSESSSSLDVQCKALLDLLTPAAT